MRVKFNRFKDIQTRLFSNSIEENKEKNLQS